jgi:hypothetical protein
MDFAILILLAIPTLTVSSVPSVSLSSSEMYPVQSARSVRPATLLQTASAAAQLTRPNVSVAM